jgi:hypothetical protein
MAAAADGTVPVAYPGTARGVQAAVQAQMDVLFVAVPLAQLPETLAVLADACTLVVGASRPGESRRLGVLATSARCGLGTAGLASSSTHQGNLATLSDVSATFLDLWESRCRSRSPAVWSPLRPVSTAPVWWHATAVVVRRPGPAEGEGQNSRYSAADSRKPCPDSRLVQVTPTSSLRHSYLPCREVDPYGSTGAPMRAVSLAHTKEAVVPRTNPCPKS